MESSAAPLLPQFKLALQRFKLWLQALILKLLLCTTVTVTGVNLIVRHVGGGAATPISLTRLPEKSRAVTKLAMHLMTHPVRADESDIQRIVSDVALKNGVPPELALAVARAESSFHPHAISGTGAMGLMQLMPATARAYGVVDPFDLRQNAEGATRLLRDLLDRYRGDVRRALAAYNAGTARVPRRGPYSVPRSTRAYIAKIMAD